MDHLLSGFADELIKIAAEKEPDKGKGFGLLDASMVAATLAPFGGLIGEQKILHDPHVAKNIMRVTDAASLDHLAKPGDIIVMSKRMDGYRPIQAAFTGADWAHVQPVVGLRDGRATTVSAGHYNRRAFKAMSQDEFLGKINTVSSDMKARGYQDAVILRPKKQMTPVQLQSFIGESLDRARTPWDGRSAVTGFTGDVFKPKLLVSEKALGKINKEMFIRYGEMPDPNTGRMTRVPMACKGNTCAGLGAQAMKASTGASVIPGKNPGSLLPADFLRSKQYEPVGALVRKTKLPSKMLPHLARGGLGVGLAAAIYGVHERPEVAGAAAGAAGATALQGIATRRVGRAMGMSAGQASRKVPSLARAAQRTVSATSTIGRMTPILKYLATGIPIKALGGLAALRIGRAAFGRDQEKTT